MTYFNVSASCRVHASAIGMKRFSRFAVFVLLPILLAACHQNGTGICDLYFVVLDAKTHEKISNYTFEMPALNGESIPGSTLYRKDGYGIFNAPSSAAISVSISAPGYSNSIITLRPRSGSTSGPVPDPREILLSK
jgi:hypothetical protein